MVKTDVLIIGSGIAGLSLAIKVAQRFPHRTCVVITKEESAESNTRYAQGGIAVVSDFQQDSFEAHIADTLRAGDGLCDPTVVDHVVRQAPERLQELIEMGADFDRNAHGELNLGREGGHKANRIIHFQDVTGLNISSALLAKAKTLPNILLRSHHVAVDLITGETAGDAPNSCYGAYVLDVENSRIEIYVSAVTVLATGGIGQLYETTTNPMIATGDGIAMAYRAGASISNMEFVQFHPTAFYDPHASPAFLISEAVRGQGAFLRNAGGERFMFRYHPDGELACRDVVSRAIALEILAGQEEYVYLDCTHIPSEALRTHFPNIFQKCLRKGVNITTDYIPVAPAAHYLCGGIDVDLRSRTSIGNLYACGECSNTGLHGANRLASNSLLEAIVFAHNCFRDIETMLDDMTPPRLDLNTTPSISMEHATNLRKRKKALQSLMTNYAGIVRNTEGLQYALGELEALEQEMHKGDKNKVPVPVQAFNQLRNMLTCAKLVVTQSLQRKENKGGFFNSSFERNEALAPSA
jgi:L-aspartate oxidase